MNAGGKSNINKSTLAVWIPILIILIPLGYSLVRYVFAQEPQGPQPFLEMPDEQYSSCVKETEYMRYHHWELLKDIREEVIRDGKRGEIGINKCRECHPNRERFCNQCHDAVNLRPDCFGCHYYPASPEMTSGERLIFQSDQPQKESGIDSDRLVEG
jgi:hypothetical protein